METTNQYNAVVEVTTYYYYYDFEAADRSEARRLAKERFDRGERENEDIVKIETFAYLENE